MKTFSVSWAQFQQPGETTRKKLKLKPVDPQKFAGPATCYLVWQDGKVYSRRIEGGREWKDAPNQRRHETAFDGRIFASGSPDQFAYGKRTSPDLLIELAQKKDPDGEYFGVRDLDRLGVRLPHGVGELLQVKHLASLVLHLLDHGGRLQTVGFAEIDGRSMTRIEILAANPAWRPVQGSDLSDLERILREARTMSEATIKEKVALAKRSAELTPRELRYVYFLDPEIGYAVRRHQELSKDGRLRIQSDCTEHRELAGQEIRVATKCITDVYVAEGSYPGEIFEAPFVSRVLEVLEFNTKPVPDELFTLNYTVPGTNVTDMTLPEAIPGKRGVAYRIPARPEDLDRVIEEARVLAQTSADRRTRGNWFKIVLIAGNIVALAGLLVYLAVRRRPKVAKP